MFVIYSGLFVWCLLLGLILVCRCILVADLIVFVFTNGCWFAGDLCLF